MQMQKQKTLAEPEVWADPDWPEPDLYGRAVAAKEVDEPAAREADGGTAQKKYDEFAHLHFGKNSTNLLISSLIAYCRDWVPAEENHFGTLLRLLDMAQVKENDENYKSPLDVLFDEIETGWRYSPDGREAPSLLRNNTTERMPGMLHDRPDGTYGRGLTPSEDPALALYKEFRSTVYKAHAQ